MSQMKAKAKKFRGSACQQFENIFDCFANHKGHSLFFDLIDSSEAAIQCSECNEEVILGSRELIEEVWLIYSTAQVP